MIDLTYRCIHDSSTMCPDRVGYVTDVDCIQMLVVTRPFHKYLKRKKTIGTAKMTLQTKQTKKNKTFLLNWNRT